ncbi:MAG: ABC transporter permease [Lachnospiraceae bacterium]|nr:ABC transporter permease [Lachnospiraceae bacterium]
MMNYIKSEWYRITRNKDIYFLTGAIAGLCVLMNVILFVSNHTIPDFRYGTVRFSMNLGIGGLQILMMTGAFLAAFLFGNAKQNGTLKNVIAYGVSRKTIFIGECIVCTAVAFCSLAVILAVYIPSALLLLDGPSGKPLQVFFKGVGATLPSAVAAVILAVVLINVFDKAISAVGLWWAIMIAVPQVCFFVGLKFEPIEKAAEWMPWNFLSMGVIANMSRYQCLWDTGEGLFQCLISGAVGILIFLVCGLFLVRKKEL